MPLGVVGRDFNSYNYVVIIVHINNNNNSPHFAGVMYGMIAYVLWVKSVPPGDHTANDRHPHALTPNSRQSSVRMFIVLLFVVLFYFIYEGSHMLVNASSRHDRHIIGRRKA